MIDIQPILSGDRLALSRLLSAVENNTPAGRQALSELFPHTGRGHLIGVTGAPGTGKSSLVNRLARHYRSWPEADQPRVAVVAVDPSSPFTGGAVLGDRIRMVELSGDPGVFVRSMASRGSLGGLARTTAGLVQVFDAAGYEIILVETVGAGQAEVDIARLAHTTLVVEAPGLGDDIQAIKAGILEIADVLVVNKADRPGVESTERALRNMLQLAHPVPRVFRHHGRVERQSLESDSQPERPLWIPPIRRTVSTDGLGIPELVEAIEEHRNYLEASGDKQRRERARLEQELRLGIREALESRWRADIVNGLFEQVLEEVVARRRSPQEAVDLLVKGPAA
jgi:LAO/AO transport system kinase